MILDVDEETGDDIEVMTDQPGCDSEVPLDRRIGAPAALKRNNRVGKNGDPRSQKEQSVAQKGQLLKRSYDHEFKKKGKGVDDRREHIEKLKKKNIPVVGHSGF